jgi:DNA-binding transcriptional MerR regulator
LLIYNLELTLSQAFLFIAGGNMTINEVAEKTGLSCHTLRYYEKIGLIKPVHRNNAGRRNYGDSDLEIIDFIQKWKSTGMQIKDIIRYIALLDSDKDSYSERLEILEKHRKHIKKRIKTAQEFLNIIDYKIEWYKKNGGVLQQKR